MLQSATDSDVFTHYWTKLDERTALGNVSVFSERSKLHWEGFCLDRPDDVVLCLRRLIWRAGFLAVVPTFTFSQLV